MDQQPKSRIIGKPFEKGKSGNPNGRPKIVEEIKTLARAHGAEAFKRVLELLQSGDERVALASAQEILNRAYGKPTQSVDLAIERRDVSDFTDAELAAILAGGSLRATEEAESAQVLN